MKSGSGFAFCKKIIAKQNLYAKPLTGSSMEYSLMSFSCPQLALNGLLATAKKYGYDGVEPRIVLKGCER